MEQRINAFEKGQAAMKFLYSINVHLNKSAVEQSIFHLVYFRVSQINGCAYCLDMHSKDLRAAGETEQRLFGLSAWRETPYFSERERAALSWAEAVTQLKDNQVSDEVYYYVSKQFSEEELIDLTLAVTTINTANRLNIAFRTTPGDYRPGQFK